MEQEHTIQTAIVENDWPNIFASWASSGQSQSVFCKQHGLSIHRFKHERKKLSKPRLKEEKGRFISGRLSDLTEPKQVKVAYQLRFPNGIQLLLNAPFQPADVKSLIEMIGVTSCT